MAYTAGEDKPDLGAGIARPEVGGASWGQALAELAEARVYSAGETVGSLAALPFRAARSLVELSVDVAGSTARAGAALVASLIRHQ